MTPAYRPPKLTSRAKMTIFVVMNREEEATGLPFFICLYENYDR